MEETRRVTTDLTPANGPLVRILGWISVVVMAAAAIAMFLTLKSA